jgi:cellulose synthase/poly-beta-1,6-N-acetylglucosamine synthase-like glycosyltransferase
MENILGYLDQQIIFDEFSLRQVEGKECKGQICKTICKALKRSFAKQKQRKFLCCCVPCYNEEKDDLIKTIHSTMDNIDFMKNKTRFNDDEVGRLLREYFESLEIVIVPIFDGCKAMAMTSSVRKWLNSDFPGSLQGMDTETSDEAAVHVRACSARWWYRCADRLPEDSLHKGDDDGSESDEESGIHLHNSLGRARLPAEEQKIGHEDPKDSYIYFQLIPIIKKTNHRKHNSHHWFFQGICSSLNPSLVFLTDCGTTYHSTCISRLVYALENGKDLIGVTARQRVSIPNTDFHPCEKTDLPFLRGNHQVQGKRPDPCWKCYLSYLLSAAPLQGFEFEATLILNASLFNLVEAMPVLPGPCQLLDWPRMKQHKVVHHYFDLLFNEDTVPRASTERNRLPQGHLNSGTRDESTEINHNFEPNPDDAPLLNSGEDPNLSTTEGTLSVATQSPLQQFFQTYFMKEEPSPTSIPNIDAIEEIKTVPSPTSDLEVGGTNATAPRGCPTLTFTEFLRVNMRLAEDRVLSFVTVFATGYGTKWIPGATFYYQPEVTFQSLLTQR